MGKFGELIDLEIPVLICFYRQRGGKSTALDTVLNEVAEEVREQAKVVKIDVDENRQLTIALKIKGVPTLMIYKDGDMVWRQNGSQKPDQLVAMLRKFRD